MFYKVLNAVDRRKLSIKTGISEDEILMLTMLTDLSIIRWGG